LILWAFRNHLVPQVNIETLYTFELFLSVMDPEARDAAMAFLSLRPRRLMKQAGKMKRRAQDIATLNGALNQA